MGGRGRTEFLVSPQICWLWVNISAAVHLSSTIFVKNWFEFSVLSGECKELKVPLQKRYYASLYAILCKLPHISYKDLVANQEVRAKIQQATGPHET